MAVSKYETKKGIRWKATVYLGTDARTGKEKRAQKKGFNTKKEAQQWESTVRLDGGYVDSSLTYEEVYRMWLETYRLQVKESTFYNVSRLYRGRILPVFGGMPIADIKPYQLQKVLNTWATQYKTCKRLAAHTKRIFTYAVRQGFIKENPFDKVDTPRTQVQALEHKKFWAKDELNAFLEACKSDILPCTYPLFRVFAYTGMRKGEVLALMWDDFDEIHGTLTVNKNIIKCKGRSKISTPKTKASYRTIALDKVTVKVLKAWRKEQAKLMLKLGYNTNREGQLIFTNNENKFWSVNSPRIFIHRVCKKIGLEPITPHGFRHTHCSILIDAGVPIKDVQARLGHSNIKTTLDIYAHAMNKNTDTAEAFAKALGE